MAATRTLFNSQSAVTAAAALAVTLGSFALSTPGAQARSRSAPIARTAEAVSNFYVARSWRPVWFANGDTQADRFLQLLASSNLDGLDPRQYNVPGLQKAVRAARTGKPAAVRKAEIALSQALVTYVGDLRRDPAIRTIYVDSELKPDQQSAHVVLQAAAAAPSLDDYLTKLGWMHPLYGQLRRSLQSGGYSTQAERDLIMLNLQRARELPAMAGRHVLVNAAAQKLYMYEGDRVVDYMRVVAGKPAQPTPMMAAYIRYTSLNPFWNVPADLAAKNIAPNVLKQGLGYLRQKGYQVLEGTSDDARAVDPKSVNWKAVAAGQQQIRMRQLPGPSNSMGRLKFMFPNDEGIYLHDTPRDELFDEAARLLSAGCVRLEDADRLAKWLHGETLKPQGKKAEQKVPLPNRVPVYLTYITAVPSGSRLAFFEDVYGWDRARLAENRSGERARS